MEWLVECISHVAQPNHTLQLHCFEMICHVIHTYKLCAINCPKNVGPVAFLDALWTIPGASSTHAGINRMIRSMQPLLTGQSASRKATSPTFFGQLMAHSLYVLIAWHIVSKRPSCK